MISPRQVGGPTAGIQADRVLLVLQIASDSKVHPMAGYDASAYLRSAEVLGVTTVGGNIF